MIVMFELRDVGGISLKDQVEFIVAAIMCHIETMGYADTDHRRKLYGSLASALMGAYCDDLAHQAKAAAEPAPAPASNEDIEWPRTIEIIEAP